MRSWKVAIALAILSLLLAFALAAAQEPVRSFEQLDTRLKPGDSVWVTDAQGREVKGKITSVGSAVLALDAGGARTFSAADVRSIEARRSDSLKNGTLIGFGIGGGLAAIWCGGAIAAKDDPDVQPGVECAEGLIAYAGLGTLIGLGIDALVPGKKVVVFRAPVAGGRSAARLSIAPLVTTRTKGVAVSFAF